MTDEEIEKLRIMQRAMAIFMSALTEVVRQPDNINLREAVAERGRLIIISLDDLCNILEGKGSQE